MGACFSSPRPLPESLTAVEADVNVDRKPQAKAIVQEPAMESIDGQEPWDMPLLGHDRFADITEVYSIGKVLGRGHFGSTRIAVHRQTGVTYAVKSILKSRLSSLKKTVDVKKEMQIMLHLAGSSHIVQLYEEYEDEDYVHLVMELCRGGELMQRLLAKGQFTEKDAASAVRTILEACAYCHELGVIHRDLKPENLLLKDQSEDSAIKVTDFGLSTFFREGQQFSDFLGTPFYVSPELLRGSHDAKCDIWSCGIILYLLLTGRPPFEGTKREEILGKVLTDDPDFSSPAWTHISPQAKDCCMRMLTRNPAQRPTARQLLQHEWVRENGCACGQPLEAEVVKRLRKFANTNQLKREALMVIAASMPADEVAGLQVMFADMDSDNSGTITLDELRRGLKRKGTHLPEAELQALLSKTDVDGDGAVDYQEFVAATLHAVKLNKEETLVNAFKRFDEDGSGHISRQELFRALSLHRQGTAVQEEVEDVLAKVDKDADGNISYHEFAEMMREHSGTAWTSDGQHLHATVSSSAAASGHNVDVARHADGYHDAPAKHNKHADPGAKYRI